MRTNGYRRLLSNRLLWAGAAGLLVWLADQPTVEGYQPLAAMFWNPGLWRLPSWDGIVLAFSWLITTLFCHALMFAIQRKRRSVQG